MKWNQTCPHIMKWDLIYPQIIKLDMMCPRCSALFGQQQLLFLFIFAHLYFPDFWTKSWSQVSSLLPPRFLPSVFIAHRVQQSHCWSIFYRVLLTYALALSASQFVHMKKSPRTYTSMHSSGLELAKLNSRN